MLDREKFKKVLDDLSFDELLNEVENEWLDCKQGAYDLNTNKGKRELAKDVAAFANLNGGYILLGIVTKKDFRILGDVLSELRPIPADAFNSQQAKAIIESWIYPKIPNVTIKSYEAKTPGGQFFVVIHVPLQSDASKPFLLFRVLDDNDKIVEIQFGYPERFGDQNDSMKIHDIHKYLQMGLGFERTIASRLTNIEEILKEKYTSPSNDLEVFQEQLDWVVEHFGMKNERFFYLYAQPDKPVKLLSIFSGTKGSIKDRLENPTVLRKNGWNFETYNPVEIVDGNCIVTEVKGRNAIVLFKNGMLVYIGRADSTFLGWHDRLDTRINPTALAEVVYEFTNFYGEVIKDFSVPPKKVELGMTLQNLHLNNEKTFLIPGLPDPKGDFFDKTPKFSPKDCIAVSESFDTVEFDVGRVAYEILKGIYVHFGLEENDVPYVLQNNGGAVVNPQSIKDL